MSDYEGLQAAVSRLHLRSSPHTKPERRRPRLHVPIVALPLRLLVDRHIRRRLDELNRAYIQLSVSSRSNDDAQWFEEASTRCVAFRDSIPQHGLPRAFALLGGVTAFLSAVAKVGGTVHLGSLHSVWRAILVPVAYVVVYAALFYVVGLRRAYLAKRRLALGNIPPTVISDPPTSNLYEAENDLFAALGRRKKPEFRLEFMGDMVVFFAAWFIALFLPEIVSFPHSIPYEVGLYAAYFALFGYILWRQRVLRRQWL